VLRERLKTVATSKLTNAADAEVFVNLDDLERDAEGNVTDAALQAAVAALLTERPYLAAKAGAGSADQGHRRDAPADFKDRKQLDQELSKFGLRART
jgi:exosome complex RNA-binding protein Rrp42 (RNase PH superfamily)